MEEINGSGTKNTFQVLWQAACSGRDADFFLQIAAGEAANKAAKHLPEIRGVRAVKQAIIESPESQQQESGCIELDHQTKESQNLRSVNGWIARLNSTNIYNLFHLIQLINRA